MIHGYISNIGLSLFIDGVVAIVTRFRTAAKFWQISPWIPDHGPKIEEKEESEEKEITRGGQMTDFDVEMTISGKHVEVDDIQGLPLGPGPIMHDGSISAPTQVADNHSRLSSTALAPPRVPPPDLRRPQRVLRHEKLWNYVTWPAWENWNVFRFNWCLYSN